MLLKMLNIQHTKNTLVGNEFVRGVSGGEKKRVSITESLATLSKLNSWDKYVVRPYLTSCSRLSAF